MDLDRRLGQPRHEALREDALSRSRPPRRQRVALHQAHGECKHDAADEQRVDGGSAAHDEASEGGGVARRRRAAAELGGGEDETAEHEEPWHPGVAPREEVDASERALLVAWPSTMWIEASRRAPSGAERLRLTVDGAATLRPPRWCSPPPPSLVHLHRSEPLAAAGAAQSDAIEGRAPPRRTPERRARPAALGGCGGERGEQRGEGQRPSLAAVASRLSRRDPPCAARRRRRRRRRRVWVGFRRRRSAATGAAPAARHRRQPTLLRPSPAPLRPFRRRAPSSVGPRYRLGEQHRRWATGRRRGRSGGGRWHRGRRRRRRRRWRRRGGGGGGGGGGVSGELGGGSDGEADGGGGVGGGVGGGGDGASTTFVTAAGGTDVTVIHPGVCGGGGDRGDGCLVEHLRSRDGRVVRAARRIHHVSKSTVNEPSRRRSASSQP